MASEINKNTAPKIRTLMTKAQADPKDHNFKSRHLWIKVRSIDLI
mgnify:CR=1 FL=1